MSIIVYVNDNDVEEDGGQGDEERGGSDKTVIIGFFLSYFYLPRFLEWGKVGRERENNSGSGGVT